MNARNVSLHDFFFLVLLIFLRFFQNPYVQKTKEIKKSIGIGSLSPISCNIVVVVVVRTD